MKHVIVDRARRNAVTINKLWQVAVFRYNCNNSSYNCTHVEAAHACLHMYGIYMYVESGVGMCAGYTTIPVQLQLWHYYGTSREGMVATDQNCHYHLL